MHSVSTMKNNVMFYINEDYRCPKSHACVFGKTMNIGLSTLVQGKYPRVYQQTPLSAKSKLVREIRDPCKRGLNQQIQVQLLAA